MQVPFDSLVGVDPKDIIVSHGPTKIYVDDYIWHSPKVGAVASYSPKPRDVEDHFGIFRGVDQIEAFVQAAGSCSIFLECVKQNLTPVELDQKYFVRFLSIGKVVFHNYLEEGDTFVSLAHIKFYKFRQLVSEGRIYKVKAGLDLDAYFRNYTDEKLLSYDLSDDFTLVAEFDEITGRSLKRELLNTNIQNGKTGNN